MPQRRHLGSRARPPLAIAAGLLLGLLPGVAAAHAIATTAGDFWGGALHVVTSPEHLLVLMGLGLLLGQGGREVAGEPLLFVIPFAVAAGVALPLWTGPSALTRAFLVVSLLVTGGLIAGALKLPRWLLWPLTLVIAFGHGFANGEALIGTTLRPGLFAAGVALAAFLLAVYAMQLVRLARPFWAQIAVRVAGSWVAATGILVLGMR